MNIDGAEQQEISKPLDIKIINEQTTAVELALLNAVGMLQKNNTKKGNIIVADPSYIYLGNLTQEKKMSLLFFI